MPGKSKEKTKVANVSDEKWVVRLRAKGEAVSDKFWAGPNVGKGTTATSIKRAKTFDTRAQAREAAVTLTASKNPKLFARTLKRSEALTPQAPATKPARKDDFAIDVMSAIQTVRKSGVSTSTDAKFAVALAEELLSVGYRKK